MLNVPCLLIKWRTKFNRGSSRAELAIIDAKKAAPKDEVDASYEAFGATESIEVGTHILTNSHSKKVYVIA